MDISEDPLPEPNELLGQWFRLYKDEFREEVRGMYKVTQRNAVDGMCLLEPEENLRRTRLAIHDRAPLPELRERLQGRHRKYLWVPGYRPTATGQDAEQS